MINSEILDSLIVIIYQTKDWNSIPDSISHTLQEILSYYIPLY